MNQSDAASSCAPAESEGLDEDGFERLRDCEQEHTSAASAGEQVVVDQPDAVGPMPHKGLNELLDRLCHEATLKLRPAKVVMSWDRGVLASGLNPLMQRLDAIFRRHVLSLPPSEFPTTSVQAERIARVSAQQQPVFPMAVRRIVN